MGALAGVWSDGGVAGEPRRRQESLRRVFAEMSHPRPDVSGLGFAGVERGQSLEGFFEFNNERRSGRRLK